MPRTLPWLQSGSSSVVAKKPVKTPAPARKRPRLVDNKSSSNDTDSDGAVQHGKSKATHSPSTSPPPEAPVERFMEEGVEGDDKYRMVEDEFLTIAKQFTVHLHAAEYHRQKKLAGTKNAEKISSISRPVTGKMPDQTKRKLESVGQSKVQRNVLQGLLGNQAAKDDDPNDSDMGDALPYVGTTLHGLMDSPRRRAASLAKFGSMAKTTRAAAGFQRSTIHLKQNGHRLSESPKSKVARHRDAIGKVPIDSSTESSDDDDDLDGPLAAPKFIPISKKTTNQKSHSMASTRISKETEPRDAGTSRPIGNVKREASSKQSFATVDVKVEESEDHELPGHRQNSGRLAAIRKRIERAKLQKAEQEKKEKRGKKLDVIPTFL